MQDISNSFDVGKKLLGPIFADYFQKMIEFFNNYDEHDTVVFFMTRGGLGIRCLFEQYLTQTGQKIKLNYKDFYASRLSIAKGCYARDREHILRYLVKQFTNKSYQIFFEAVFKGIILKDDFKQRDEIISYKGLKQLLEENSSYGKLMRDYLLKQQQNFEGYMDSLREHKSNVILIDTGWLGTSQENLMRAYPEINWIGAYFGKWDYYNQKPWYFNKVNGLAIRHNKYTKQYIRAGILFYHHIIEAPLEPDMPSTEEYISSISGIRPDVVVSSDIRGMFKNDFFKGISTYISNLSQIVHEAQVESAYEILVKKIIFPSQKDIEILDVGSRGEDFGKHIEVNVITPRGIHLLERLNHIRYAIWKQGQMTKEFPKMHILFQFIYFIYRNRQGIRP